MNQNKRILDVDHALFFGTYLLCMLNAMLIEYSTIGDLLPKGTAQKGILTAAAALIVIKLIYDEAYPLKRFLFMCLVGGVWMLSYLRSGYNHLFYLLILFLGCENIDAERCLRVDFWARLFLSLIVVLCAVLSISENYVTYRTGSEVLRYSMGFNHPNTLAAVVLSLIMEDAYRNRRRGAPVYCMLLWGIAGGIYMLTANRTAVTILVLFPVLLLWSGRKHKQGPGSLNLAIARLWPWAACILTIGMMLYCRKAPFLWKLDELFGNRYYNAQRLYLQYGIPILGQHVELISVKISRLQGEMIALLDVGYLRMLLQGGVMSLILFLITECAGIIKTAEKNDNSLFLIFFLFSLFGLFESGVNNPFLNFTLLYGVKALYELGLARTEEERAI